MQSQILEFSLLVVAASGSIGLITAGVLVLNTEARMARRLRSVDAVQDGPVQISPLVMALQSLLILPGKDREEIEQYLHSAGYRDPHAPLIVGLIRIFAVLSLGGGLFFLISGIGHPRALALMSGLIGACIGYLAPKTILRMSSSRKKRKIQAELPFTLDVIVMMLEAGVSVDQCFRTFAGVEGKAAPLVQETVAALVRDLDVGSPYDQALSRWADRLGVPGGQELARVIQQALSQGTPLVQVLKEFAREFAERRVAAAREAVGKMTTKMTVVMVLFILPALMIVLTGPAISSLAGTLQGLSR